MDKEDVVHICNGILPSHKRDDVERFSAMWIDLEFVIHGEVSQEDENKQSILVHICGI